MVNDFKNLIRLGALWAFKVHPEYFKLQWVKGEENKESNLHSSSSGLGVRTRYRHPVWWLPLLCQSHPLPTPSVRSCLDLDHDSENIQTTHVSIILNNEQQINGKSVNLQRIQLTFRVYFLLLYSGSKTTEHPIQINLEQ